MILNSGYLIGLGDVEHNGLYTINATNISRDWESGYVDDYDLELVRYDEVEKSDV